VYKVLVVDPIHEKGIECLKKETDVIVGDIDTDIKNFFNQNIGGANGIIVRGTPVNKELMEKAKDLKVIAVHGSGYNNIDVVYATKKNIPVLNTPGISTEAVTEHILGLILALTKRIAYADRRLRAGKVYSKYEHMNYIGIEIFQRKLGIIGLGKIGLEVARKCIKAFHMKVLGYYPNIMSEEKRRIVNELGIDIFQNLHEMLKQIDVLSINVPLTDKTRNMISTEELKLMKPSAYLINTARGAVVDEKALINALKSNHIAGAGLDVFVQEPPSAKNPLLSLENVCVTPHIAIGTEETLTKTALTLCTQVLKVLHGERPDYIVNPEVLN